MLVVCVLGGIILFGALPAAGQRPQTQPPAARSYTPRPAPAPYPDGGCGGSVPPIPPADPRIRRYNDAAWALALAGVVWEAAGWWALLHWRIAAAIRAWAARRTRRLIVQTAFVWSAVSAFMAIFMLPASFVNYMLDRSYGFATLGPLLWLQDRLRGWAFGLSAIVPLWFAWMLMRRSPRRWWLWLWAAAIPWSIAATIIQPVVVDAAYNRFTPLPPGPLRSQIAELARKAGVRGAQILVADASRRTTRSNAYVTGIGPTRRIVLWNTTLRDLPRDEILVVVAHELGHYVLGHIWWILAGNLAGALVVLWALSIAYPWALHRWGSRWGIQEPADLAAVPLAMLLLHVLVFAQMPAASAFSRYLEHAADRYALDLTHDNCAAARLFVDFVRRDYADPDPPRLVVLWFYSHPPVRERFNFALHYHPWRVRRRPKEPRQAICPGEGRQGGLGSAGRALCACAWRPLRA